MALSNPYPHGKPAIFPPQELFEASNRLRQAEYDEAWLRNEALPSIERYAAALKRHAANFKSEDEIYYLWALCLQAEIHDYYGDRKAALNVLIKDGQRLEQQLPKGTLGYSVSREFSPPLMRQQLWTLVFYAHCHYRSVKMEDARALLKNINNYLDEHLPINPNNKEPSYGLRARVAYSLGQVARQMSDVSTARDQFILAIDFTKKRLTAKLGKPRTNRAREQTYANYIIAKAFVFGLAWASYHSGELQRGLAASAAGSAMLETTGDELHKAYAQVMYAQILTAQARPVGRGEDVPPELSHALDILEFLAEDPQSPLASFPKFRARAQYHLARALFTAGEYKRAEACARAVYDAEHSTNADRWRLECASLLVRLLLKQERLEDARRQADQFMQLTEENNVSDNLCAEAWLCRAEVLMQAEIMVENQVEKALAEAAALWKNNPLSLAVCTLQQARFFCLKKDVKSARHALSYWKARPANIEHGYVKELARNVTQEIVALEDVLEFTLQDLKDEQFAGLEKRLREWSIQQLFEVYGPAYLQDENVNELLGLSGRTVRYWKKQMNFNPRQKSGRDDMER